MRKPALWHVTFWLVLFAAGVAVGYSLRDRRAEGDQEASALLGGLGRASQAQITLVMLEQNRAAQLQPMLERQLAIDVRSAYQSLVAGKTRLPGAMPSLAEALHRAGEYLGRRHAPSDLVQQANWVSDHLKTGR